MIHKSLLSVSLLSAMLFVGCDNTAKIPEAKEATQASSNAKPITIGYSDWPGFVAWAGGVEKG